jgi:hypothetical protein
MVFLALGGVVGALLNEPAPRSATTTTVKVTTTTLPDLGKLGSNGAELERLLTAGSLATYHGVYTVDDPTLPEGLTQSFEVWRKRGNARTDIIERLGDSRSVTRSVTNGNTSITCKTIDGDPQCDKVAASAVIDLANLFVRAVVLAEPPPKLDVRDGAVAGFVARCFSAKDVGELCLTTDGVMLSTDLEDAKIVIAELRDEVLDAVFDVTIPNRKVPTTTSTTVAGSTTTPADSP